MPSAIRQRSYNSVTIYSIDESIIWQALQDLTKSLSVREEILAIILFGSLARDRFGVGSDVDVLILWQDSDRPFLDRIVLYRPQRFPVDIDVFPYTLAEYQQGQPLVRQALAEGRALWLRAGFSLLELPPFLDPSEASS